MTAKAEILSPVLPWYRLRVLQQFSLPELEQSPAALQLSPLWKLLLLSDGSVTRHLQLLTGETTEVDLIGMAPIGHDPDGAPAAIAEIPGPRLRRQVWLRTASGTRLAYAASWWDASLVDAYLRDKSLPIWASLAANKAELYREIRALVQGHSPALEAAFACSGPFWGRYYFFWHDRKPLTLIYEVFSPEIQKYLNHTDQR